MMTGSAISAEASSPTANRSPANGPATGRSARAAPCAVPADREGGEGERAIADVRPLTYGAQPPALRVGVKRPRRRPREIVTGDIGPTEPASRVEVVEGGKGLVAVADRAFRVSLAQQVPAVSAGGPVAPPGGGSGVLLRGARR